MTTPSLRHCRRCRNKGLIRVKYQSGEPFDIAICDCQAGQFWRSLGETAIRAHFGGLPPLHQVSAWEYFDGETGTSPQPDDSFVQAGQTRKRAKL